MKTPSLADSLRLLPRIQKCISRFSGNTEHGFSLHQADEPVSATNLLVMQTRTRLKQIRAELVVADALRKPDLVRDVSVRNLLMQTLAEPEQWSGLSQD